MAVLQTSVLSFFLPAFTFLLILVVLFAILNKTKILGEDARVQWVAAFSIGMIVLFSAKTVEFINFLTPWFAVMAIFLLFIFMIPMFLGKQTQDIWSAIGGHYMVIIISILIVVIAISVVFEPVFTPFRDSNGEGGKTIGGEVLRTLFHPRILGAIFILIIASFAIRNISQVAT